MRSAAGCLVVAAAVTSGLVAFVPQGGATTTATPIEHASARVAPAASTSAQAVAVAEALPTPEPPPSDPHAPVPEIEAFTLSIPALGLDRSVGEGVELTVIDRGPAHWPGTAAPGGWGNVVVAAHRTTHGGPFRRIDELDAGDLITLRDLRGSHVYAVTGSEVVTPDEMRIVEQQPGRAITLFACHPVGSATHRYVVHGELLWSVEA